MSQRQTEQAFQAAADTVNAAMLGCTVEQLGRARRQRTCLYESCPHMLDLYPVFCNEHGPIAYNMEVKASTIPGAGLGLFTLTDLQAGDFVALYHSDVRLVQGEEKNNDYCLEIPPDLHAGVMFMIDASDVGSTLGRYANDSRCSLPNGSYAFQPTPEGYMIPFIKASRAIRAGEEIFVAYGQSYWDAHDRRARTNNTASVL